MSDLFYLQTQQAAQQFTEQLQDLQYGVLCSEDSSGVHAGLHVAD